MSRHSGLVTVVMLRTAVIGTGYLGRFHAQKYAALPDNKLVGVADIDPEKGEAVARECNTRYFSDYHGLLELVDAVSVVVPTCYHFPVARDFLSAGTHVLVEKPTCDDLGHSMELVKLASQKKRVLQVGFLERFNLALSDVQPLIHNPRFIESHRLAGFKPRSMDINVIMDLMIHDLDIILSLVDSSIVDIAANGASVLSSSLDIAQARITFASGCVANVTASRISQECKRKMRLFQPDGCVCVDFQHLTMNHFYKGNGEMFPGIPAIENKAYNYSDGDSLKREIEDFLNCVRLGKKPRVCGESGHRALEAAIRISQIIDGGAA